jgi:hypothetical protein
MFNFACCVCQDSDKENMKKVDGLHFGATPSGDVATFDEPPKSGAGDSVGNQAYYVLENSSEWRKEELPALKENEEVKKSPEPFQKVITEPTPAPVKEEGMQMVFVSKGQEHSICFTHKPLGLIFNKKVPLVVEVTYANETADKLLQVQPGWALRSINNANIEGMTYQQVIQLMAPSAEELPLDERLQKGLKIVFESNGEEHPVCFPSKPLGIQLSASLPLIVRVSSGAAEQLGVQTGWTVKSFFDLEIAKSGLTYAQVANVMAAYSKYLPQQ